MKNKLFLLISIFFLFVILLSGCGDKKSETVTPPPVDKPAVTETAPASETNTAVAESDHGCVKSDGYVWCEVKASCIKEADEKCEKPANPMVTKRSYDLIEEALAKMVSKTPEDFVLGIKKLTLTHFLGVINGKEGIVLAAKKNNDWVIVFDSVFGEKKGYSCDEVANYNFPSDMIGDCTK